MRPRVKKEVIDDIDKGPRALRKESGAEGTGSCSAASAAEALCCLRKPQMPVRGGALGDAGSRLGMPKRWRRLTPGESGARGAWKVRGEFALRGAAGDEKESRGGHSRFAGGSLTPGDPAARTSRPLGEKRAGAEGAGLEGDAYCAGAAGIKDAAGAVHAQGAAPQATHRCL